MTRSHWINENTAGVAFLSLRTDDQGDAAQVLPVKNKMRFVASARLLRHSVGRSAPRAKASLPG